MRAAVERAAGSSAAGMKARACALLAPNRRMTVACGDGYGLGGELSAG